MEKSHITSLCHLFLYCFSLRLPFYSVSPEYAFYSLNLLDQSPNHEPSNSYSVTISHWIPRLFLIFLWVQGSHLFLRWLTSKTKFVNDTPRRPWGLTHHVAPFICGLFRLSDPILFHCKSSHWGGPSACLIYTLYLASSLSGWWISASLLMKG